MKYEYPRITGGNPVEELRQVRAFLYNLVEQLNLQENRETAAEHQSVAYQLSGDSVPESSPAGTFNSIKSLIIKSAEIIEAYTVAVGNGLEGRYVAEACFPDGSAKFVRATTQATETNATNIKQLFGDYQSILSDVQGIENQQIITNAYIKAGELFTADEEFVEIMDLSGEIEEGTPIYGVAVGQTSNEFRAFARFTSFGLLFYDKDDHLVAYITKQQLHIRRVRVRESLQRGGYIEYMQADGGTVEKWEDI